MTILRGRRQRGSLLESFLRNLASTLSELEPFANWGFKGLVTPNKVGESRRTVGANVTGACRERTESEDRALISVAIMSNVSGVKTNLADGSSGAAEALGRCLRRI